jgi:adenylyltransferase/sulfurtransferase
MKIHIPTPLRVYTAKQETVAVEATTVGEALAQLTAHHPDLKKHLYTEEGKLRSFVNIYLNDEDVRYLPEKETTAVTEADALTIIPSIAGGSTNVLEWTARLPLKPAEGLNGAPGVAKENHGNLG